MMYGYSIYDFQEIASLSVEPCEGETIIVTVFQIKKSEVVAYSTLFEFLVRVLCLCE